MIIKINKTRISLWFNKKRFSKIELNKLIITNGYSKEHKNLWCQYRFNTIHDCVEILQKYLKKNKINISPTEIQFIHDFYQNLTH